MKEVTKRVSVLSFSERDFKVFIPLVLKANPREECVRAELPGNGDYSTDDATLFRICVRKNIEIFLCCPSPVRYTSIFLSFPSVVLLVFLVGLSTPRISFLFGELLTVVVAQRVKDAGL